MSKDKVEIETLWKDRKRIIFGLPWSFTKYSFSDERLFIQTGFFNLKENECRLYRILDLSLSRSFWQRIFNLGTITVNSSDKTLKDFELKNIKNPREVKELLSKTIEEQRDKKRVISREDMHDHSHDDDYSDTEYHDEHY
jgi:uncharacterized membrane protein YdbT with pleckstrin-like domain